jgi:transcription-repair coupling factor (superfamily II helicase)
MNLSGLLVAVRQASDYRGMLNALLQSPATASASWPAPSGREPSGCSPRGFRWALLDAARPAVLAALQQDWHGPIMVLTPQPERAHYLREQVGLWSPDAAAAWYFPAPDALFYDLTPWDGETIRGRVTLLSALATGGPGIRSSLIFCSVWALMTRTLPPQHVLPGIRQLRVGQGVRLKDWLDQLVAYAYQPVSVVEEPGTFSQRGGILDVYPSNAGQPVRVELLGEQIESMRAFDPASQRSLQQVESIELYPASEALPGHGQAVGECLPEMTSGSSAFGGMRLQRDRERLSRGEYFRGMEFYVPCLYPTRSSTIFLLTP